MQFKGLNGKLRRLEAAMQQDTVGTQTSLQLQFCYHFVKPKSTLGTTLDCCA